MQVRVPAAFWQNFPFILSIIFAVWGGVAQGNAEQVAIFGAQCIALSQFSNAGVNLLLCFMLITTQRFGRCWRHLVI